MIHNKTQKASCPHHSESTPSHAHEINRLNRIIGQLTGVKKMIEEQVYCPQILIQTKAIRSAILALELSILEGHLHNCVQAAFTLKDPQDMETKIQELLEIFKKSQS